MKQKIKQPFSTFISGFEKKIKNGGDGFQWSNHEKLFQQAFNNEMHKKFIGIFIPATFIAYCTMFHGMKNQFKILQVKMGWRRR